MYEIVEFVQNAKERGTRAICLCGSTKFKREYQFAQKEISEAGLVCLTVECFLHADKCWAARDIKTELDELHLRKIDIADEVLVLAVGGYIGDSTRSEIAYAVRLGKPISHFWGPRGRYSPEDQENDGHPD